MFWWRHNMDKPVEATPKYLTTIKKNYTVSVGAEIRDTYRTSGYGSILIILPLQQKKIAWPTWDVSCIFRIYKRTT